LRKTLFSLLAAAPALAFAGAPGQVDSGDTAVVLVSAGLVLLAATNRPEILDPALLRAGRFDRQVLVDRPDKKGRIAILAVHLRKAKLADDVDPEKIAALTPGFSGADLANLVNEAAILAARKEQRAVSQENLLVSIEKVMLGPERRSHILSVREKEVTAYHEAGHALVAAFVAHSDPVHKVSIISRGRAGGYTLKLPSQDKYLKTKREFEADLAVLLASPKFRYTTGNFLTVDGGLPEAFPR